VRIETERLWMRPIETSDVAALHALFVLPDVRRYLWDDVVIERDVVADVAEASAASFMSQGYGFWWVERQGEPGLVGFGGLRDYEDPASGPRPEVLYGLDPAHWRNGYALEIAVAMLRFGFEECDFTRIDAGIDPPNARSRSVLERLGMGSWRRLEFSGLPADYAHLTRAEFAAAAHSRAAYRLERD